MSGQLNWLKGGIALGLTFALCVILVKPIGVSTQFVIADGLAWNLLSPDLIQVDGERSSGYRSTNAYLDAGKGKYAANVMKPMSYGLLFALFMIVGGALSHFTRGPQVPEDDRVVPAVWRERYGNNSLTRYVAAFIAGFVVLYGARLAGGCTSGHMMSGMMQTSVSGYLFALGAFGAAIPTALFLYGRKQSDLQGREQHRLRS